METNTYYEIQFDENTSKSFSTELEAKDFAKANERPAVDIYKVVTTKELVS